MQRARLEHWYVNSNDELCGDVYGHPKFPDGAGVKTTRVVYWDNEKNQAVTKNTEYSLGTPLSAEKKNVSM